MAFAPEPIDADLLTELLEVFTHNILYMRRAYPYGIFQKRRMYNCTVYRSRFPILNEYISNALRSAQFLHKSGQLLQFEVVLAADEAGTPNDGTPLKLESYFFVISGNKPSTATENITSGSGQKTVPAAPTVAVSGKRASRADHAVADYERLTQFEDKMRAMLLQLDAKSKNLRALPARVLFSIQLHTTRSGQTRLTDDVQLQDFPWMGQEDQHQKGTSSIVPLADVSGIHIYTECYD